jgi:hypothetical protein
MDPNGIAPIKASFGFSKGADPSVTSVEVFYGTSPDTTNWTKFATLNRGDIAGKDSSADPFGSDISFRVIVHYANGTTSFAQIDYYNPALGWPEVKVTSLTKRPGGTDRDVLDVFLSEGEGRADRLTDGNVWVASRANDLHFLDRTYKILGASLGFSFN